MRWKLLTLVVVIASIGGCSQEPEKAATPTAQEFFHVFSRPNDDTFQNAAGNAGQPYEVARVKTAIVADYSSNSAKLKFTWSAVMVTGRHVEAGQYFVLQRVSSNLDGMAASDFSTMSIVYPAGKDKDSSSEEKKMSRLQSAIELGEAKYPGYYEGDLILKIHAPELKEGNTKHFVDGGPKEGVFKRIHWSLRYDGKQVSDVALTYRRAKEPQVKLIESNIVAIDRSNPLHQPYPEQPRAALCHEESVGNGDHDTENDSVQVRFQREFGTKLKTVGCLSCHGEGVGDNQLFCDDGRALTPSTTYRSIVTFLDESFDWEVKDPTGKRRYRLAMESCFKDLRKDLTHSEYRDLRALFGN